MTATDLPTLDASDINELSIAERLDVLDELRRDAGVAGLANLEGVLRFFDSYGSGLPEPGSAG